MTETSELRQKYREESTTELLNKFDLLDEKLELVEEELMFRQSSGQKLQHDDQITMIENRLFGSG